MHWFRSITQKKREGWVSLSSETFSHVVFLFWPFLQQAVEHLEVFRTLSTKGYQAFFPGKNRGPGSELGGESRAKSLVLWHFTCQAASSHPPLKFYGFEKEFCLIMPFTTCSEYQYGFNVIVISLFKMDFDLKYQIWSRRCKSAALTRIFTWNFQVGRQATAAAAAAVCCVGGNFSAIVGHRKLKAAARFPHCCGIGLQKYCVLRMGWVLFHKKCEIFQFLTTFDGSW